MVLWKGWFQNQGDVGEIACRVATFDSRMRCRTLERGAQSLRCAVAPAGRQRWRCCRQHGRRNHSPIMTYRWRRLNAFAFWTAKRLKLREDDVKTMRENR